MVSCSTRDVMNSNSSTRNSSGLSDKYPSEEYTISMERGCWRNSIASGRDSCRGLNDNTVWTRLRSLAATDGWWALCELAPLISLHWARQCNNAALEIIDRGQHTFFSESVRLSMRNWGVGVGGVGGTSSPLSPLSSCSPSCSKSLLMPLWRETLLAGMVWASSPLTRLSNSPHLTSSSWHSIGYIIETVKELNYQYLSCLVPAE